MRAKYLLFTVVAFAALAAATSWAQDPAATPQAEGNPPPPSRQNSAAPAAPKTPGPPPSVTIIGAQEAHGVLGRDVRTPADEDIGHIVHLIVERADGAR